MGQALKTPGTVTWSISGGFTDEGKLNFGARKTGGDDVLLTQLLHYLRDNGPYEFRSNGDGHDDVENETVIWQISVGSPKRLHKDKKLGGAKKK